MKRVLFLAFVLFLPGCVSTKNYESYLVQKGIALPAPEQFSHCRGYGCKYIDSVSLTGKEWRQIQKPFKRVKTAEDERKALKTAVGTFEKIVGAKTGTEEDKGGTYVKLGAYQHDCVDESVNTTIYLAVLQEKGWLKFHDVLIPQSRLPILSGRLGPHQTAVIRDRDTGIAWAVDSWFHDNGMPPEVVEESKWFLGWRPPSR